MRFTFATFVLVSAFLEASAIRIPLPPKLPGTPNTPNTPNMPNTPNNPGRLPDPNTPNTPNTPGRLPDPISCSGRRRAVECTIDSKKWDDFQVETKYRQPGAHAIADLDSIKSHPGDAQPNTEDITRKYSTEIYEDSTFNNKITIERLKMEKDTQFTEFVVYNKKENVDEVIDNIKRAGGDQRDLDKVADILKTRQILQTKSNPDHGVIAIELSFGRKYDVYRDYDEEGLQRPALHGNKDDSIRWSDQVMDGWKAAIREKDATLTIKDVPLKSIIRSEVNNADTNNVIEAAMQKAGQKFGNKEGEDSIVFSKNDENKEGFEAMAGTIHGKRVNVPASEPPKQASRHPNKLSATHYLSTTTAPPTNTQSAYKEADINIAISSIKQGQIRSVNRAAQTFNVP
ncbi:hypothetical protein P154DRAFT_573957 [Amniculicola lignicola CBS 123094]|uniref:Uncharacterized protein n=1 Tax=Amniculicola lignicola CBS 123094 TaxID=1392246 RepID=A0A6A5WLP1_9PLEO|nr:hypothetical protein P154DRAFT_573957 [Amniculicola lignicola CBS 123094]